MAGFEVEITDCDDGSGDEDDRFFIRSPVFLILTGELPGFEDDEEGELTVEPGDKFSVEAVAITEEGGEEKNCIAIFTDMDLADRYASRSPGRVMRIAEVDEADFMLSIIRQLKGDQTIAIDPGFDENLGQWQCECLVEVNEFVEKLTECDE